MKKLIIVGANTAAKQIYEMVKFYNLYEVIGFAVNKDYRNSNCFMDFPLYELETLSEKISDDYYVFVAIQWNRLNADRKKVFEFCREKGFKFANVISPSSIVRSPLLGSNCYIDDNVVIMDNVRIGDDVYFKAQTIIGPNCEIGSHTFFGVHSTIGGGSSIGEQSFVGLSAVVFDDTVVGRKCIVGAATALKRNLPDFCVYKSNSDNCMIKQYTEDIIEQKLLFRKNVR